MSTPASLLPALGLLLTLGLISWLHIRDRRRHPLDLVIGSVVVFVASAEG